MNTDLIPSVLALALVAIPVMSQPVSKIEIKGVKASSSRLTCGGPESSVTFTVELSVVGETNTSDKIAIVSLGAYTLDPSENRVLLNRTTRSVSLNTLPAYANFTVVCGPQTVNGSNKFAAAIIGASKGLSFHPFPLTFSEIQTIAKPTPEKHAEQGQK